jgi:hypothetical protein
MWMALTEGELSEKYFFGRRVEGGRRGRPIILNGLKTFLETGKALPEFDFTK